MSVEYELESLLEWAEDKDPFELDVLIQEKLYHLFNIRTLRRWDFVHHFELEDVPEGYDGCSLNELANKLASDYVLEYVLRRTKPDLEEWWDEFSEVPILHGDDGQALIDEDFKFWEKGTNREEIWEWFDKHYSGGVRQLMFPDTEAGHDE